MLTFLTLTLFAQAAACSPRDALGNPRTTESGQLTVQRRGASSGIQFTTFWTEVEKFDSEPPPYQPNTPTGVQVAWHTLAMTSAVFQYGLSSIPEVQDPETCQLPTDGRLVFIWNAQTGLLSAQIAYDFQTETVRQQNPRPNLNGRNICLVKRESSPSVAQLGSNGRVEFVGTYDPNLPPQLYEAYPGTVPMTMEEALASSHPQSALGRFKLVGTGEVVDEAPVYRCHFDPWQEVQCERNLIVARTADEKYWYLWFDGEPPASNPQ